MWSGVVGFPARAGAQHGPRGDSSLGFKDVVVLWLLADVTLHTYADDMLAVIEQLSAGEGPRLRPCLRRPRDVVGPPAIGHALRRKYGSRITVREPANAGHAMIIERPDTVARKMLAVLAEHPISR